MISKYTAEKEKLTKNIDREEVKQTPQVKSSKEDPLEKYVGDGTFKLG